MLRKGLLLFILLFFPAAAHAAFPAPTGFVNDFAHVLADGTKNTLEGLLSSFERSTGIEIAVATLPSLEGRTVEDVAVDLYKRWGIGKKGKDNGLLFLVAPNDRRMRIEVGYGLEGAINDAQAGRILDENVVPRFREGDLSGGITAGTTAIVQTIIQKEGLSFSVAGAVGSTSVDVPPPLGKKKTLPIVFKILGFILMAYLFVRHPWLFLLLLSSGGGSRGGGGFSGGFGGFGGGSSGGGGASRSW